MSLHTIDAGSGAAPMPSSAFAPAWRRPVQALLQRLLSRTQHGALHLELPNGTRLHARGTHAGPEATLTLHRWRALRRLLLEGDSGLALAWRDGDCASPDLLALLQFGIANEAAFGATLDGSAWHRQLARLAHQRRANTRRGSRDNIAFHYDLGNDFYAQWLDGGMLYSSALYLAGEPTLEAAQAARLTRILDLLGTPAGGRVLEIGCGWGALALAIAQRHGAHVTGLTLSAQQLAYARARAEQCGLSSHLDLRLQDYREVQGRYERIVSIEMVEAVGEAYWPTYFGVLRDRLAPGGRAVLQAITIDDAHFARYRQGADFIQRFIFPGGMLPSPAVLREQAARAGLVLREELRFGAGYAATLAEWRRRFLAAWPAIAAQGFDEKFKRLWEYYLCYCEAGFHAGRVDVGLYTLEHR